MSLCCFKLGSAPQRSKAKFLRKGFLQRKGKRIAKERNRDQSRQLRWISRCRLREGDSLLGRGKYTTRSP